MAVGKENVGYNLRLMTVLMKFNIATSMYLREKQQARDRSSVDGTFVAASSVPETLLIDIWREIMFMPKRFDVLEVEVCR